MWTGDGRSAVERAADKAGLVQLHLLQALSREPAWQALVERVRKGADPLELASILGSGPRRTRVGASLLAHAAARGPHAVTYVVPDEEPSRARFEYREGEWTLVGVEDGDPDAEGSLPAANRYSAAFWWSVDRGITCLVRRVAVQCLECGESLPAPRLEARGAGKREARWSYCAGCGTEETADRDAMDAVFRLVATPPPRPAPPRLPPMHPKEVIPAADVSILVDAAREIDQIESAGDWSLPQRDRWLSLRARTRQLRASCAPVDP